MDYSKPSRAIHICRSPDCGCGLTRRDFLRLSALTAASVAAPLLSAGDARAQGIALYTTLPALVIYDSE